MSHSVTGCVVRCDKYFGAILLEPLHADFCTSNARGEAMDVSLMGAAASDDPFRAELALLHGEPVNGTDKKNRDNPLLEATKHGSLRALQVMLRAEGVEVDPRDLKNNRTPLHIACERGDMKVASELLAFGAVLVLEDAPHESAAPFGYMEGASHSDGKSPFRLQVANLSSDVVHVFHLLRSTPTLPIASEDGVCCDAASNNS